MIKHKDYGKGKIPEMVRTLATIFNQNPDYVMATLVHNFPEIKDKSVCPHCGASMESYWHSLTPGLVNTLIKFIESVKILGRNRVHLQTECELTKNEYNNFQKLSYFGLVAKCMKDGKHESGYWLVTRNGGAFLRNELPIPRSVRTFRDRLEEKSIKTIKISEIEGMNTEYWQKEFPSYFHD
jgi:hypothetical protein